MDAPKFSSERLDGDLSGIGLFVSGIARAALILQRNTPGAIPTVNIIATKTENKITLQVEKPENGSNDFGRVDPIYIDVLGERLKITSKTVASK